MISLNQCNFIQNTITTIFNIIAYKQIFGLLKYKVIYYIQLYSIIFKSFLV